ncbi:uncharacterized protein LOC131271848 isoform X2 [Anopheles coustani]|uniref:uncharacterized protein LOC131271848 isoform X2 n=1 Tax=Anopheles coustani TaxID=139045 RepID=UPI0026584F30|nr:uncharacterized protein LOC131271848 isoform X2 [Anopheles coustani]
MGLLGWIKKDKRHRRRDSAPPTIGQDQDVAYREALAKFNDWRAQQRNSDIVPGDQLPHSDSTKESSTFQPRISLAHGPIKEESSGDDSDLEDDFSSDVEVARSERKLLSRSTTRFEVPKSPRYARHHRADGPPKKPKRSVEFYRNINRIPVDVSTQNVTGQWNNGLGAVEKNHSNPTDLMRHSLPVTLGTDRAERTHKQPKAVPKPNNTIYENEVAEFEAHQFDGTFGDSYVVQSPPRLFYKANSSPYSDGTPKKQNNLKTRPRAFKDKPAPAPPAGAMSVAPVSSSCPTKQRKYSDSDSPLTGSYRKYELNSSSVYDEHVISSRAYRGTMVPKGRAEDTKQQQHKSLSYQTVVNKHGDLVDYALPFSDHADTTASEANVLDVVQHSPQQQAPGQDTLAEIRNCEQLVNDNFQFLQCTALQDDSTSIITEPISVLKGRSGRMVTDLDRSNGSTLKDVDEELEREDRLLQSRQQEIDVQLAQLALQEDPQDILLELDSLQKWSKSIQMSDDFLQTRYSERNLLECFRRTVGTSLPTCYPNEVRYRVGGLRSAFGSPLEFSCGLFRGAAVTLRKYSLNMERSLYFAEEACRRDFEVLSQVRHPTMATLMAVAYDGALNQATLLMEPFDFTLFDYIHKMNKRLSLIHAITVVQQISSAVCYLQQCGYVHSNISSGCILMRRYPYAVKLTSFELTTDAASDEVRREIESRYGSTSSSRNSMTSSQNDELKKITTYARLIKNDEQFLRDKYRKLSKEMCENRSKPYPAFASLGSEGSEYDCRASRFLPYCKEYRERFSLFYYVAPELLVPKSSFVYPSKSTDVYSIALLLWEILNGYVPFVVYNRAELEKLHTSTDLPLPMFEKERCERFRQIFEGGLGDLGNRKMSMDNVVDLLDCLLLELGMEKHGAHDWLAEDYEEQTNSSEVRLKNELNDVRKQGAHVEKTDKIYFHTEESDLAKTTKTAGEQPRPKKPARKLNRTKALIGEEPEPRTLPTTERRSPLPQRPPRVGKNVLLPSDKKSPLSSSFSLSNSAIYQTIFDFNNKFLSPKSSSKQVAYDRTSTVKKHKKPPRASKKAAKELFEVVDQLNKSFIEIDGQEEPEATTKGSLEKLAKSVEHPELDKHFEEKRSVEPSEGAHRRELATVRPSSDTDEMHTPVPHDHPSKSCDSSPGTRRRTGTPKLNNSFRFTIGDFTLPDTPIARKNKIRKHAWLSDQKLRMANDESLPMTPEDCRSKSFFNAGLATRSGSFLTSTNLNSSVSLQDIKPKRINISVNIIRSPEAPRTTVVVQKNSPQLQPSVPSSEKSPGVANGMFESLWKKEKIICERSRLRLPGEEEESEQQEGHEGEEKLETEQTATPLDDSLSIVTAHLTSVRDAIKKIETTFEKTGFDYSPARKTEGSGRKPSTGGARNLPDGSLVVEENLLVPTKVLELEKTLEAEDAAEAKEASEAPEQRKDVVSTLPVPISAPPPSPSNKTSSVDSPNFAVTHLNVLLGSHQSKPREAPVSTKAEIKESTPTPAQVAATVPTGFAPNSQLYLRRKALNSGTTNSSVAIHHQQTVYRESIVSTTDLSVPIAESFPVGASGTGVAAAAAGSSVPLGSARKKKLTTRVTVNMRKISRRASDISPASSRPNSANLEDLELPSSGCITPTGSAPSCPGGVRHSCGNELLRAFSKLRLIAPAVDDPGQKSGADGSTQVARAQTPVNLVASNSGQPGQLTAAGRADRFVCCNCGNSMIPAESFNVPAGSRIGMAAAFGDMTFPRESVASLFEPPMTPTSASTLAGRFHAMTPFQKSTEDLYIDDDFCQGLNHMGANMELVEPLDEGQFLDTYGYDIYATEIYHAEEEEEEDADVDGADSERELHFAYRSHLTTPLASGECTEDEAKFVEKCSQLNSNQSLVAEFPTLTSPLDTAPPLPLTPTPTK